jgi:23S rRNA maturation mini-RNase III
MEQGGAGWVRTLWKVFRGFKSIDSIKLILFFRTFFPNKLEKHQKSCTKGKPMINPNKVKGLASKLESLVNYPEQKRQKVDKRERNAEVTKENLSCNCHEEDSCSEENIAVDMLLQNDKPTLKDFMDVIKENEVLEDSEMSKQLLFLMNYFITMKKTENKKLFPKIS